MAFHQPNESHQVSSAPQSSYRHGYEQAQAWVEAHRERILHRLRIAAVVVGAAILVAVVGVYGFGWQNAFSYVLSYPLPLPAATVDGSPVWYRDYVQQADYIESVMAYQNGQNEQERATPQATINTQAVDNAIAHTVLERAADKRDIEVPEAEVGEHYQATYPDESQRSQLTDKFGVSEGVLKQQIRYRIMLGKLEQRLIEEEKIKKQSSAMAWINQRVADRQVTYWLPQLES